LNFLNACWKFLSAGFFLWDVNLGVPSSRGSASDLMTSSHLITIHQKAEVRLSAAIFFMKKKDFRAYLSREANL
jgi:hypothetical protein